MKTPTTSSKKENQIGQKLTNHFKVFLLFSSFLFSSLSLFGQLDLLDEESFFIGGLSPNVLSQGQVEVNFYSALFSNWVALHEAPVESPVRDRWRFTDFTTNVEAYTGLSQSGRWDLGLRLKYTRTRFDNAARSSPFRVFQNKTSEENNEDVDKSYGGFKEIGIRLRFVPFEDEPQFTINGGFSFSPLRDDEVSRNLQADRNAIDLNLAYNVQLNNNAYYYFIANGVAFSPSSLETDTNNDGLIDRVVDDKWRFNTGVSFFVVQLFANRKLAFFPGISYNIGFKKPDNPARDEAFIKTNEQVLGVLGLQIQPNSSFSLNLSTAIPLILRNSNKLYENVVESYSFVSIGGRLVIR